MQLNEQRSRQILFGAFAVLGTVIISLIVFSPYVPQNVDLVPGQIARSTTKSPKYLEFQTDENKATTLLEVTRKIQEAGKTYKIDQAVTALQLRRLDKFFSELTEFRATSPMPGPDRLGHSLQFLDQQSLRLFHDMDKSTFSSVEFFAIQNLKRAYLQGIYSVNVTEIATTLHGEAASLGISGPNEELVQKIVVGFLVPNLVIDDQKTRDKIDFIHQSEKRHMTILYPGTTVIRKGETITSTHVEILKALDIYQHPIEFWRWVGVLFITAILFLVIERFIFLFGVKLFRNWKYFVLTYSVILLVVAAGRLIMLVPPVPVLHNLLILIPVPVAAMLLTLLTKPSIGLLCGTVICFLVGMMLKGDFGVILFLFLANAISVFSVINRRTRTSVVKSGYIIGGASAIFVVCLGLFRGEHDLFWYLGSSALAMGNGILSVMITIALMQYLEELFNIVSPTSLLEVGNLNHPLLKRLMVVAPATYQHSMIVSTLAEAGAEAIEADAILAKIGAFFHDIGKMRRPGFFTENQWGEDNPHDSLTPRMSKLVIAAHVKDGYELATKHKLPDPIKDFILQHHGTTLVSFFYTKAKKTEEFTEPSEADFRYAGPKPQFKETGIVMLADSCEATVRSLEKPTVQKIEATIDRIFREKIEDHQLDECPLTLLEITQVKNAFITVFKGLYHTRLSYQDEVALLTTERGGPV